MLKSKFESLTRTKFKGSWDPNHFIFEINGGKSRIRHRTTPNLNGNIFNWFGVDLDIHFQSHSMADPMLSDIVFKNKLAWVWTTLKLGKNSFSPRCFVNSNKWISIKTFELIPIVILNLNSTVGTSWSRTIGGLKFQNKEMRNELERTSIYQ